MMLMVWNWLVTKLPEKDRSKFSWMEAGKRFGLEYNNCY